MLDQGRAAGFLLAGEPLAVDLVDTLITSLDPVVDLMGDEAACAKWWSLQSRRFPFAGPAPTRAETARLRAPVRRLLDAVIAGAEPDPGDIDAVNQVSATMPRTRRIRCSDGSWLIESIPHPASRKKPGPALVAVADSLIDLVAGPGLGRLRRCANPACSMLFVATDARRRFCTQDVCANRTRVARHYQRHHHGPEASASGS